MICFQSEIELAGALRFELRTSVLETDILPVETTRLKIFGVSDGNRTRNIRFGRPALSRLSFAHKIWCIGKDSNFHSETATVLQTACLNRRRPMRVKNKILCKNEKGRDLDRLRAQLCPE